MRQVGKRHIQPDSITQTLLGRIALLNLALLVASCGSSSGGDVPTQPEQTLGTDASLASLSMSVAALEPVFSPTVSDYAVAVGFAATSTRVTAVPEDANATISLNGAALTPGAASDPIPLDEGDNLISVNVIAEDGTTTQTYTVAVSRQSASAFTQAAYVKASDARTEARFGPRAALSADGEILSVVAVGRENAFPYPLNVACNEDPFVTGGGVYQFARNGEGVWAQHPVVNSEYSSRFGADLGLSADASTLAVSVPNAGSVYMFTREPSVAWLREETVFASDWLLNHESGIRVALSSDGSTLAVGSVLGVDILTRDQDGGWIQQAYLQALGADYSEGYGDIALSADGALLAVAGWGERAGVHIFGRDSDDVWSQEAYNSSVSSGARIALSADGSTLAAGAGSGVHVLTRGSGWAQQVYLQGSNAEPGDMAKGVALSADGSMLAVGAYLEDSAATGVNGDGTGNSAIDSGAVYVFTRDSGAAWTERAYIKASNTGAGDAFGFDVALSADGTVLAVGAPGEAGAATGINADGTDNSLACSGAVYLFEL